MKHAKAMRLLRLPRQVQPQTLGDRPRDPNIFDRPTLIIHGIHTCFHFGICATVIDFPRFVQVRDVGEGVQGRDAVGGVGAGDGGGDACF